MQHSLLMTVTMFAVCTIAVIGVMRSPALAGSATPSSCYQNSPEWSQAEIAIAILEKSEAISSIVKQRQLEAFTALKQTRDAYYHGTAPICDALEKFEAQCSEVFTVQQEQACQSWADKINAVGEQINGAWKASLTKFITETYEAYGSQTASRP